MDNINKQKNIVHYKKVCVEIKDVNFCYTVEKVYGQPLKNLNLRIRNGRDERTNCKYQRKIY